MKDLLPLRHSFPLISDWLYLLGYCLCPIYFFPSPKPKTFFSRSWNGSILGMISIGQVWIMYQPSEQSVWQRIWALWLTKLQPRDQSNKVWIWAACICETKEKKKKMYQTKDSAGQCKKKMVLSYISLNETTDLNMYLLLLHFLLILISLQLFIQIREVSRSFSLIQFLSGKYCICFVLF